MMALSLPFSIFHNYGNVKDTILPIHKGVKIQYLEIELGFQVVDTDLIFSDLR